MRLSLNAKLLCKCIWYEENAIKIYKWRQLQTANKAANAKTNNKNNANKYVGWTQIDIIKIQLNH